MYIYIYNVCIYNVYTYIIVCTHMMYDGDPWASHELVEGFRAKHHAVPFDLEPGRIDGGDQNGDFTNQNVDSKLIQANFLIGQ